MFVEQEELRCDNRRHEECQRLTLAAGEQAHGLLHPVLEPQPELGELFAEGGAVGTGDDGEGRALAVRAQEGQREVFLDRHIRCGAAHRILKHAADELAALIVGHARQLLSVEHDASAVNGKAPGNGVEERALAGAVAAEDGHEVAGLQRQRQILQCRLFVDGAGVKRLGDMPQFQHGYTLLSVRSARGRDLCCWRRYGRAIASATMTAEMSLRHSAGRFSRRATAMMKR